MSSPAITVTEHMPYMEIARLFIEKSINRTPVVDQEGRLVGIVSRADILEATQAHQLQDFPSTRLNHVRELFCVK